MNQPLTLQFEENTLLVTLNPHQFRLTQLEAYPMLLESGLYYSQGEIRESNEGGLILAYHRPPGFETLTELAQKSDLVERLLLAQRMQVLLSLFKQPAIPYIHPNNIWINGASLLIGHRGMQGAVAPSEQSPQAFLDAYKALVVYLILPQLPFDQLLGGLPAVKHAFAEKISHAESVEEVVSLVDQQAHIQLEKQAEEKVLVVKKRYQLFKWGSLGLAILIILTGAFWSYASLIRLPKEGRMRQAQTAYIAQDYATVIEKLNGDSPSSLPKDIQYPLAVSSVQEDNLNKEQKEAVLRTLSAKSSANTLSYWIYMGRAQYEKALDVAQNIGDIQYILHAYSRRYDQVNADSKMSGAKKKELLEKYKKEMDQLEKELNEAKAGTSATNSATSGDQATSATSTSSTPAEGAPASSSTASTGDTAASSTPASSSTEVKNGN